ncbi:hypothetical protein FI667_g4022, partial [Globisporangium splendens]
MDECEALTEADVLDTIEFVVQGQRQAHATEAHNHTPNHSASHAQQTASEEDNDDDGESLRSASLSSSSARVNPYKNRQKLELEYLKAKVRELEKELRRVEQDNQERLVEEGDSIWQRIAQQQSIERQKALSENAKLKQQLQEQIKFSKSLEKIIRKRPNQTAFGGSTLNAQPLKRRSLPEKFRGDLLQSAEDYYRTLEETMRDMRADRITKDHRSIDIRVLKNASGFDDGIRIETMEARRFPFSFQSVARELWNFLSVASNSEQVIEHISRKVEHTSDTLFASTDMQFPVGEDKFGVLNAMAGFRKFEEEDRIVLTYVSHGECYAKKHPKDKFSVIEKGWYVQFASFDSLLPAPISPKMGINILFYMLSWVHRPISTAFRLLVKTIPGSPDASLFLAGGQFSPSLAEWEHRSGSHYLSPTSNEKCNFDEEPFEVGILTEAIFNAYQKTASYIYAVIENTLMDEQLQQRTKGSDSSETRTMEATPPAAF